MILKLNSQSLFFPHKLKTVYFKRRYTVYKLFCNIFSKFSKEDLKNILQNIETKIKENNFANDKHVNDKNN